MSFVSAETRAITIHVSDRVYAGLIERGRTAGYAPTLYAKLLFEAAFAARVGKGSDDPILQACVEASLARRTPVAPAVAPAPVQVITRAVAVPLIVPVVLPVPIPVSLEVRSAEPTAVHISGHQPITAEAAEAIGALVAAAVMKLGVMGHEAALAATRAPEPITAFGSQPIEPEPTEPGATLRGWSPSQLTFARLVCREEGVSVTEAKEALVPWYQSTRSLSALVSATRPKLRAVGIEIEPVDIWGWRVVAHDRAAAEVFLGRAA